MNVLLIDDNPDDRALIVRRLRREFPEARFREVIRQADFEAALEEGGFDIVLTDYYLNWTDGLWVLSRINACLPSVPVVMFTDTGGEEIAVEGMKAGLSDYVLKSHPTRLPIAIKESLEKARLRRTREEAQEALKQANEALEHRVAERTGELERLHERLALVTASLSDVIYTVDREGRLTFV